MTDESADIAPKNAVSSSDAEPDEDRIKINIGSLQVSDTVVGGSSGVIGSTGGVVFLAAAAVYSKAFVEALARRHADGVANLVRTGVRRKGKPDETRIGVNDGSAATIAITADTPDEARLALLDLDVTADAVHGKLLRWDSSVSAWRSDDDQ